MSTKDELIAEATELGLETEGMTKAQLEAAIADAKKDDAAAAEANEAAIAAATGKAEAEAPKAENKPVAGKLGGRPAQEGAKLYTVTSNIVASGYVYRLGDTAALTDIQAKPLLKHGVVKLLA